LRLDAYNGGHSARHPSGPSTQFTYSRTFIEAVADEPDVWLVRNRLEGNFPGGVVTDLVIQP
jgi:hypothetical protein